MEATQLVCFKCKHFRRFTGDGGCNAFPKGIPDEITSGKNEHKKPLKEQKNDIVFEPIKENEKK